MRSRARLPRRPAIRARRPDPFDHVAVDAYRAVNDARRKRGQSIRTIATGVRVFVGVVHKTLAEARLTAAEGNPR
ncbi:hypothetical protein ACBJ59_24000 [Nonomuraea sp. MTCD27]|uniref:hypothetical protein n=1 Tax=Nonomuraea sp. MTCD27 TaxID=1676747 RepID=UPI0035BF62F0